MAAKSRRLQESNNNSSRRFFKVLMSGYRHKLYIPKAFTKTLCGLVKDCKEATLNTPMGKSWHVKLKRESDSMCFEEGWEKFVKDHDLNLRDFCVFEHVGFLVFKVLLFDPSSCEKDYPPSSTSTPVVKKKKEKTKPVSKRLSAMEKAEAYASSRPHFIKSIGASNLFKRQPIDVPTQFAKLNGLSKIRSVVTLRDPQKNLYTVTLGNTTYKSRLRVRFGAGIFECLKVNDVQAGDVCVMELDLVAKMKNKIIFDVLIFK